MAEQEKEYGDAPRPIEMSPLGMALDEALASPPVAPIASIVSRMPARREAEQEEELPRRRRGVF